MSIFLTFSHGSRFGRLIFSSHGSTFPFSPLSQLTHLINFIRPSLSRATQEHHARPSIVTSHVSSSSTFVSHISHLITNVEQVKGVATSVPISTIYRQISYRFGLISGDSGGGSFEDRQ
ncbi:hypothetical protein Hdeb2414_s0085g00782951 [Helianthus debilis subsp. tardiflorus]